MSVSLFSTAIKAKTPTQLIQFQAASTSYAADTTNHVFIQIFEHSRLMCLNREAWPKRVQRGGKRNGETTAMTACLDAEAWENDARCKHDEPTPKPIDAL